MQNRIQELVEKYNLQPHPEGGFYSETYRAEDSIHTENGERNLMTVIYFLLTSANISRFHVIESDEFWFHHEGADISVHVLDGNGYEVLLLGNKSPNARPQQLVKKRKVFGSTVDEPDSYALVSCVVAPGFDFSDFRMLSKQELLLDYPKHHDIIERLGS